jgi:hypothetical protein
LIASHTCFFNETARLESYIVLSGVNSTVKQDTFTVVNPELAAQRWQDSWMTTLQISTNLRKKISAKELLDFGLKAGIVFYNFNDKQTTAEGELVPQIQVDGKTYTLDGYGQWQAVNKLWNWALQPVAGGDVLFHRNGTSRWK